jgi:proton-dependent oligopeptide transporter, POT family
MVQSEPPPGIVQTQQYDRNSENEAEKQSYTISSPGFHDDLESPTEDERRTLRRVADSIPWNTYC